MKLYLIRHGRQCSKRCNVNVDLSEEGYRQAALLGQRLAYTGIDAVYSSDLLRAVETAQAANLYWNVEHTIDARLREINFGDMEGMTDEDIAIRFAAFQEKQDQMLEDIPYPGGECAADVIARAMPMFEELVNSGFQNVAVVTHGGLIRSIVSHLIGLDPAKHRILGSSLENCCITEVSYDTVKKRFTLERFNDYAHLEPYPELLRSHWIQVEN